MRIQNKISLCCIWEHPIPYLCGHYNIFQRFRVQTRVQTLLIVGNTPHHPPPPTLNQGGRFDFLKFSNKKGRAGKIGGILRNGNLWLVLTLSKVIFLSVYVLCLFPSFTPFLTVSFVFHRKNLVLLNLISRYMASTRK